MSVLLLPSLDAAGYAAAFPDSRETLDRLATYADRLRLWQGTMNLVAPATLDTIWHRHFADSAQLLEHAPREARRWLDLGSGAGFPGLVLAIRLAGRPDAGAHRVTLIESDQRKAAFLAEVVRASGLSTLLAVEIVARRIEDTTTRATLGTADVVTARALAPLDRLLALAGPYFHPATVGLFPKGRGAEAELEAARRSWRFDAVLAPSRTEAEGRIIIVRDPRPPVPPGRGGPQQAGEQGGSR